MFPLPLAAIAANAVGAAGATAGGGGLLASIAAPVLGTLGNFLGQSWGNKATNEANMKLAKYQYNKGLEMWNKQNEYNAPNAQMARLASAGLNPNLVYGNGSVVGNTTQAPPQYQPPRIDKHINTAQMLSTYQDIQLKQEQINQTKAATKAIQAETAIKIIREKTLQSDLPQKQRIADWFNGPYGAEWAHRKYQWLPEISEWYGREQYANEAKRGDILMQEQRKNELDIEFKKYQNDLASIGVTSSDHPLFRIIIQLASRLGFSPVQIIQKLKQ